MASMGRDAPTLIAFGGAFDPPHCGHQDMVRLALAAFPAARLLVLPAAQPATAKGREPKFAQSSFADRLRLCELAFAGLSPRVQVTPLEADLPAPNRTLTTLLRLSQEFAGERLGFLLGQDQLTAFPQWHEPMAILGLATLLVAARRHSEAAPAATPPAAAPSLDELHTCVERCGAALGMGLDWATPQSGRFTGPRATSVHLLSGTVCPAASSTIRSQLQHQEEPAASWLSQEVRDYIRTHQLYTPAATPWPPVASAKGSPA